MSNIQFGWRVLKHIKNTDILTSCVQQEYAGAINYYIDKWVKPRKNFGDLTVFTTYEGGLYFGTEMAKNSFMNQLELWPCLYVQSDRMFVGTTKDKRYLEDLYTINENLILPDSVDLAKKIKILYVKNPHIWKPPGR